MFHLSFPAEGFVELYAGDRLVLRHSPETPALFLGFGREEIRMYRGNFTVRDREDARLPLRFLGAEGECLRFAHPDLCFVFANLIVSSDKLRTIQVGIRYFTNQFSTDYVSMYAAIVISIVPSILGYILFQEQIIAGMTSGAVKG